MSDFLFSSGSLTLCHPLLQFVLDIFACKKVVFHLSLNLYSDWEALTEDLVVMLSYELALHWTHSPKSSLSDGLALCCAHSLVNLILTIIPSALVCFCFSKIVILMIIMIPNVLKYALVSSRESERWRRELQISLYRTDRQADTHVTS